MRFRRVKCVLCFVSVAFLATIAFRAVEPNWAQGTPNACRNADDAFMDFELGADRTEIKSTISSLECINTGGLDRLNGDIRTGEYNVDPYGSRAYETNGNCFAWLGEAGNRERITFRGSKATDLSVLVSTYSGVTLDAYDEAGVFLANSGWAESNIRTGTLTRLPVEAEGIAYVETHDTGRYWLMDDLCKDAVPSCLLLEGRSSGHPDSRVDLVSVPDLDYDGDEAAFLADVNRQIDQRLGDVVPVDAHEDDFDFYYTTLEGHVSCIRWASARSRTTC